jgi:hypothetical protein
MLKILQYLLLALIILLLCGQVAGGTIGIAEWQESTPGGNKIGNNDGLPSKVGTAIYSDRDYSDSYYKVYVKNVQKYGFYNGAIAGKSAGGFFLFNEQTKNVTYFSSQQQLCFDIEQRKLNFNDNLRFLKTNNHTDYYVIKHSFYFLIPFIVLFGTYWLFKKRMSFSQKIDSILNDRAFLLSLFGTVLVTNWIFISSRSSEAIFDLIVAAILLGFVSLPLWLIAQLSGRVIDRIKIWAEKFNFRYLDNVISLGNSIVFLGIFMLGLSLTVSSWQTPWTSIKYFSCFLP